MAPKHRVGFREDFFFGVFNTRTVLLQVDRFMDEVKKKPSEIWLGSRGFSWQWFPNRGAGPFYGCETLANGGSGWEILFLFQNRFFFPLWRAGDVTMWTQRGALQTPLIVFQLATLLTFCTFLLLIGCEPVSAIKFNWDAKKKKFVSVELLS